MAELGTASGARPDSRLDPEVHAAAVRAGERLRNLGYDEAAVTAAAHRTPYAALEPGDTTIADYLIDPQDPLGCAIDLLLLRRPVAAERASRLLGARLLNDLRLLDIITGERDIQGRVAVAPFEDLILVGDPPTSAPDGGDRFVAVSPSSVTVARLAPQRAATTLDLGTGCGLLALLSARRGAAAIASDVSADALHFAAINGALNGANDIEWRRGDWLEATNAGERFDAITANLPYVLAPSRRDRYSDAGAEGDAVTRHLASALPGLLTPNGVSVLLGTWALRSGDDWPEVLVAGAADVPCSVLAIELATHDPLSYAVEWNDPLRRRDEVAFAEAVRAWLTHQQQLGIERLVTAVVVARRIEGAHSGLVTLAAPAIPGARAAEQVGRALDALELGLDDPDAVLQAVIAPAPGLLVQQTLAQRGLHPLTAVAASAGVDGGLSVALPLSPATVAVLGACDGQRTLAEAASAIAIQTRMDEPRLKNDAAHATLDLLRCGLVTVRGVGAHQ